MTIFDKVRALGLPLGEYVVVGSGPMEALGLRAASDLDIVVTPALRARLEADGSWQKVEKYGKTFLQREGIEIIPELEWEAYRTTLAEAIAGAMVLDGIPFLNLDELKKFKTAMGREKDFRDIALIDRHLAGQRL